MTKVSRQSYFNLRFTLCIIDTTIITTLHHSPSILHTSLQSQFFQITIILPKKKKIDSIQFDQRTIIDCKNDTYTVKCRKDEREGARVFGEES